MPQIVVEHAHGRLADHVDRPRHRIGRYRQAAGKRLEQDLKTSREWRWGSALLNIVPGRKRRGM